MSEEGTPVPESGGEDASPAADTSSRTPLRLIILIIFVLIVTAGAVWFYFFRDVRTDAWEEPTVAYEEADCEGRDDCEIYATLPMGHGEGSQEMQLEYDPTIDDEIAQWGDCLGSVFVCIEQGMTAEGEPDRTSVITTCVANADCPDDCKSRFASRTSNADFDRLEAVFFDMFVDEGGYCVPREADR